MRYFQRILSKVVSLEGKIKTETSRRNDKNTEKQFYTKCVQGKMKGYLSLVFFFPSKLLFWGKEKNCKAAGVSKSEGGKKRIGSVVLNIPN